MEGEKRGEFRDDEKRFENVDDEDDDKEEGNTQAHTKNSLSLLTALLLLSPCLLYNC